MSVNYSPLFEYVFCIHCGLYQIWWLFHNKDPANAGCLGRRAHLNIETKTLIKQLMRQRFSHFSMKFLLLPLLNINYFVLQRRVPTKHFCQIETETKRMFRSIYRLKHFWQLRPGNWAVNRDLLISDEFSSHIAALQSAPLLSAGKKLKSIWCESVAKL